MPKVPVATQTVGLSSLPSTAITANATPQSFANFATSISPILAGGEQGLTKLGFVQAQQESEERRRADVALTRDALNNSMKSTREFLYGENGIYNQKGKDAIEATKRAEEGFEKFKNQELAKLKSQQQKDLFLASFDSMKETHLNGVARHEREEINKYDIQTIEANNSEISKSMQGFANDPEQLAKQEILLRANANALNAKNGIPLNSPVGRDTTKKVVHEAYTGVYESINDRDPESALKFLNDNKDKFYDQKVYDGLKASSQKKVDAIVVDREATKIHSLNLTWEDRDKLIAQQPEHLQSDIKESLITKDHIQDKIRRDKIDLAEEPIWNDMARTPALFNTDDPKLPESIRPSLKRYKQQFLREDAGDWKGGNPGRYSDLSAQVGTNEFLKVDLDQHIEALGTEKYMQLKTAQYNQRRNRLSNSKQDKDQLQAPYAQMNNYIRRIPEFNVKDKNDVKAVIQSQELRDQFISAYEKELSKLSPENNNTETRSKVLSNMLRIADPSFWEGGGEPLYEFQLNQLEGNEFQKYKREIIPEKIRSYRDFDQDDMVYEKGHDLPWVLQTKDEIIRFDEAGTPQQRYIRKTR